MVNKEESNVRTLSSFLTFTPSDSKTLQMVKTSSKLGASTIDAGVSGRSVATIIGKTAFLALETRTFP